MNAAWLIFVLGVLLLGTGCRSTKQPTGLDETIPVEYSISDGLKVTIIFESPRAYNRTQLGLTMLNKTENKGTIVRVDEQDFFPEYFAIVNTKIDDGLLFISDEESYQFARRTFRAYQKKVTPTELLLDVSKSQLFEEIIISDREKRLSREKE